MRAGQKTFAEEFERVLVESDTSVRRLARLTGISRRTYENWLYGNTLRPRYIDQILQVARALQLQAVDTDRLLLSAGYPTLTRLRQNKQLQPDILLEWQLPPDVQTGQKNSALHHAQQLLRKMPWNEEAHREVMELLALNGRRSEALKQFDICQQALHDEFGVEPSAETLALYERIRRTSHFSRDNIPAIVTPLIGREGELETLSRLLADPGVRLVTLTGLGGTGKTRLALDVAWRHTDGQFRDGVTFVQLAALETANLLVPAIAQALHLPLKAAEEKAVHNELIEYLKSKQLLLVLDNCEHLLDGMPLVADILEAVPMVQILATSRERLCLRAEYVFPLPGLPYDDRPDHQAAQLFQGTARRIKPQFKITNSNSTHINRLCRLVDGNPLALELAAGMLDRTSVAALADEIERSLDYLVSDLRDMPARHRSLRAVLESTWTRLQPQTRRVFAALSAFRGSFSPAAAQVVTGANRELLEQLVAHSLLEFDGEVDRYQLHEMLRQFATEKLNSEPEFERAVLRGHFNYYSDLVQRGDSEIRGGDQPEWMAWLELETNNIRQAIDWAVSNNIELAAHLVVSLHNYWHISGQIQEAMQQYARIMAYQESLSPEIHPWLMAVYAEMMFLVGRTRDSIALETRALPLFLNQRDEAGAAFVYFLWSITARRISEDINTSIQLAEAGLQHALAPGTDSFYASLLLESLSDSLSRSGRYNEAEARIKQGYQLCAQRDDLMTANYFLAQMTMLAAMQGQPMEARRFAEECLIASRQLNMVMAELIALDNLAIIDYAAGNLDQAKEFVADGIALAREKNHRYYLAAMEIVMGDILMAKDAIQEALPFLREALSLYQEMDHQFGIPESVERLAEWVWRSYQTESAVCWMACAITRLTAGGELQAPDEIARRTRIRAELEANLGEEEVARAWAEGEQMTVEEVLEELLLALPQETKAA